MIIRVLTACGILGLACGAEPDTPTEADPFVDRVVDFKQGPGGGFNADKLPEIVLGPPRGNGDRIGGSHVFSLGHNGSITLEFVDNEVIDGEGPDLIVFENSIKPEPDLGAVDPGYDLAKVEVSEDGMTWKEFPYDTGTRKGCAGHLPVYANPESDEGQNISPTDPEKAGGEAFDIGELGLKAIRFVRITDLGISRLGGEKTKGFDLDAVAAVHSQPRVVKK